MPKSKVQPIPELLAKLGKMTAIRDTHLVEQSLLRTLGPLLGVLETTLYRVDDNQVVVRSLHHFRTMETASNGASRVTERTDEVLNNDDIPEKLRNLFNNIRLLGRTCCVKTEQGLIIGYPLHGDNELRGYFIFERDREVTPVEDAVVQGILQVFSNYYALLDTSQRDQLTGLYNRYSLETNLDRIWNLLMARLKEADKADPKKNRRDTEPQTYWLGVMDIDHFKKINDTYGHIIGDEVLILVTRLLEKTFRRSDLLYRYGGEEFIAIVAANDLEAATMVFERARQIIEQFKFPQVEHVTISGGFSCADPSVLPQAVINRADRSLYQAKSDGRNRIYHYDTLIKQGALKEVAAGGIDLF